jgi:uncharacterized protein (TIGR01777 family)
MNPFIGKTPQRVLVTGGTGFIGEAVVRQMLDAGHSLCVLSRNPQRASTRFEGRARCIDSLARLADDEAFDALINLAGAPVVGPRWSRRRQEALLASRVGVSEALLAWLRRAQHKPALWLQASAVGYYGVRDPEERLDERSAMGRGFMAELCARWEAAARPAVELGVRQVTMRLGVVFGPGGGALLPLLLPHRLALGGRLGSGRQVISWVHRDDVLQFIARALSDERLDGVYNLVAPGAVSQAEFAASAGKVLGRPVWLHLPAAPIRWLAGEMAELFVDGQRVLPQRLQEAGFSFRYPSLEPALRDLA